VLAAAVVAIAAGCGGATDEGAEPTLPAPLAEQLAVRADAVGDRIAAGDPCAAAAEADDLLHATVRAVREGQVPAALQDELVTATQQLLQRIDCPVAEPAAPEPPVEPAEIEPPLEEEEEEEEEEQEEDETGDDGDDADDDDDEDRQGQGKGQGKDKGGKGRGRGRG
jgi:hypothetical protein